ncbi:MAG: hypothetical protein V3S98_08130, partial [Dehalococcoidia bacterium]
MRFLLFTFVSLSVLLVAACSSDDPTPTPGATDDETAYIEELDAAAASLDESIKSFRELAGPIFPR